MMRKKLQRRLLISILLAVFGLMTALSLPVFSAGGQNALDFVPLGRESYNLGNLEKAELSEGRAVAYEEKGDREGLTKSLINESQALQNLGFYPKACSLLVKALFDIENADCTELTLGNRTFQKQQAGEQLLLEEIRHCLQDFEEKDRQDSLSLTQAIGLRSFGNVLRQLDRLELSERVLNLSLNVAQKWQSPADESAAYLDLGNTERAIANRKLNREQYRSISTLISSSNENKSVKEALGYYQEAFDRYDDSAAVEFAPEVTKIKAQVNSLNLLLDAKEWWDEEIEKRIFSWDNPDSLQYQKFDQPDYRNELERAKKFKNLLDSELNREVGYFSQLILQNYRNLTLDRSTLYPQISIGKSLMRAGKNFATNNISPSAIEEVLNVALTEAKTIEDRRAEAYVFGYLGELYEEQALNNFNLTPTQREALLTNATDNILKAVWLSQNDGIDSLPSQVTYLWKSRLGGLYEEQEKLFAGEPERQKELRKQAIAAYSSAVNTLETLRQDLTTNSREIRLDFLQDVAPVYRELIDLLLGTDLTEGELKKLAVIFNSNQTQNAVLEDDKIKTPVELALQLIELLQIAELESFFREPCLPSPEEFVLGKFDKQAAVIYPIILKDRLEVILLLPEKTVKVEKKGTDFTATLNKLYDNLSNGNLIFSSIRITDFGEEKERELLEINQQLIEPLLEQVYNWLIEPFEGELEANEIKTLAFVLTDTFQKIPMAALYNNGEYLLEKYNIALIPSLQLLNPQPSREKLNVLAAGLSQIPTEEFETALPLLLVENEMTEIENVFTGANKDLPIRFSDSSEYEKALIDSPPLECSQPQSEDLGSSREKADNSPVKQLLNCDFKSEKLQEQISGKSSFSVVHLATHGQFSSDPEETFILTSEGKINVQEFRKIFDRYSDGRDNSNFNEIELLVLSACKTAAGDERAVLGMAGLAVRSGARSTVATLWSVAEAPSPIFVKRFYEELKKGTNKAKALRKAQLELFENPEYRHPVYWAPYVLVNDWRGFGG